MEDDGELLVVLAFKFIEPAARVLTYVLILKTTGRIYGLDLGKDHHNPACQQVGEKHKHHWREQFRTPRRAAFATAVPEGLPTMTGFLACKELAAGLGSLFLCSEHGDYQRIRTPYLYPDGDMVDLFCKVQDGIVTVSDLGETTRWLRMQTVSPRRSPKQSGLIEDICLNHGVEFYRGMLLARVRSDEGFSAVVTRVAQAAMRVSDLWFTFRTRAVESAGDEIADFLAERDLPFDRGERLVGRSGRPYTVDFHVRTPARSSLLYVLSTGSRSAARPIVNQVVTAWYDLNHLAAGPEALQFVSLFDDTADVWSDEDLRLVEGLSRLAWLSKTEDLEEILRAAA